MSQPWPQCQNILIARLDNIGDVVMLSPSLRAIKAALPQVQLTLLASPAGSSAACLLPEIDDTITWRAVWQDVGHRMPLDPERELELVETLRSRQFDAAFICTSFSQTPYGVAYACYLAGIPLRYGQSKECGGSLLTHELRSADDSQHQVERSLRLVESAGFPAQGRDIRLRVPCGAAVQAIFLLAHQRLPSPEGYILLHPGASCPARTYPVERFAAAVDMIVRQTGIPAVITGSEKDHPLVEEVRKRMHHRVIDLAGKTTVPEWAALVRGARLLISSHTGSIHLADAFRTPAVVLFSGTDLISQWAPRFAPSRVLQRPVRCMPCYGFTCTRGMECLDISPQEVAGAARELLEAEAIPPARHRAA